MIYKKFQDEQISHLGLGMMRLPQNSKDSSDIDEKATAEMVEYAIKNGVNYFDTAWGYHDGQSETVAGKILSAYERSSYKLASKFPGYDLANFGKVEDIFEKQLQKCQTSYFDFYLFHNICEMNIEQYLDEEKYKTFSYLIEQKRNGRIKHLGLSVHGDYETLKRFLDCYGEHMEFCQIQLNWIDFNFQEANKKLELLKERNIPVWVMEPLRGGKLAKLDDTDSARLKALRPDETDVSWAFRYLQSLDTTVIFSGMSNLEQLKNNIEILSQNKLTTEEENSVLYKIAERITGRVPCTECRYCTSYCPQQIDIPLMIKLYNEHKFTANGFIAPMLLSSVDDGKKPSDCISCGACSAVCPQQIKIPEIMSDFTNRLK